MKFDFRENALNQLLINPRLSETEKNDFTSLQSEFEKKFGLKNYFLVPSSGSSKKQNETAKLIALHRDAVLASARRFNQYFNATADDHWGLVLPTFHVAGLGTYARAFLAGSKVFENDLTSEQIRFISLVPTQIFDLVQKNEKAPTHWKTVLVGAGAMNPELKEKAEALAYPMAETYGMTETASMIAVKKNNILHAMPGVQVAVENSHLKIKCDSLLTCYLQKKDGQVILTEPVQDGWYETEDQATVNGDQINLLGRSSDYIKILGEGVSLAELRDKLAAISLRQKISFNAYALLAIDHARSGAEIILAVENSVNSEIMKSLVADFNQSVRPYEKISKTVIVDQIPLSDLGKIRTQELTEIVLKKM